MPSIINKKAKFEYEFIDRYKAGIALTGTEVKSVRAGNVNMGDAFCTFFKGNLILRNLHIGVYKQGSYNNHEPMRERVLLLKKPELKKLLNKTKEKGLTIVPIEIFFSETGYAKIEIALARGKKTYDKRDDLKQKDIKRNTDRELA
ncbi:MAG: SsrA-binding protein SmpB [Bacteroidota bacterium]|nr:SsrA-binding protein SmpB [Bacteroidota bacterium]